MAKTTRVDPVLPAPTYNITGLTWEEWNAILSGLRAYGDRLSVDNLYKRLYHELSNQASQWP